MPLIDELAAANTVDPAEGIWSGKERPAPSEPTHTEPLRPNKANAKPEKSPGLVGISIPKFALILAAGIIGGSAFGLWRA